jgi:heme exporter protein D
VTREFDPHLTQAQLDDFLIGLSTEASARHLENCATCSAQVEEFRATMALVDKSSMAWSRVRAAGMENPSLPTGVHRLALSTIVWSVVCVLTVSLAIPVWHSMKQPAQHAQEQPGQQQRAGSSAAQTAGSEDSEAQIAADNKLLQEVDTALNASEASPLGEFTASGQLQEKARRQ